MSAGAEPEGRGESKPAVVPARQNLGRSEAMARRMLPARGAQPALELFEIGQRAPGKAPVLCLHGAFGGAWVWTERFLPALARSGRRAAAVSFRGHGGSEGGAALGRTTLSDYSADVLTAMDALGEPPVVVAHSLGALLAQRLLGSRPLRALVMLAPLPPDGMISITPRLLITAPRLWLALMAASGNDHTMAFSQLRRMVFSGQFAPGDVKRYIARMVVESHSVLLECHLPLPVMPAGAVGTPALVIEAGEDLIVPHDAVLRTSLFHWAEHQVVRDAGHLLQLELGADLVAQDVVGWLASRGL